MSRNIAQVRTELAYTWVSPHATLPWYTAAHSTPPSNRRRACSVPQAAVDGPQSAARQSCRRKVHSCSHAPQLLRHCQAARLRRRGPHCRAGCAAQHGHRGAPYSGRTQARARGGGSTTYEDSLRDATSELTVSGCVVRSKNLDDDVRCAKTAKRRFESPQLLKAIPAGRQRGASGRSGYPSGGDSGDTEEGPRATLQEKYHQYSTQVTGAGFEYMKSASAGRLCLQFRANFCTDLVQHHLPSRTLY